MSEPHLDFSQDHLPTAQLHNDRAHSDFDWESVLANLDGEMDTLREDLDEASFRKLERSLTAVFAWVLSSKDTGGFGVDCAIGRRFLALAVAVVPDLVGKTRGELCNELRVSKQALSAQVLDARRFLRGLRV